MKGGLHGKQPHKVERHLVPGLPRLWKTAAWDDRTEYLPIPDTMAAKVRSFYRNKQNAPRQCKQVETKGQARRTQKQQTSNLSMYMAG